MSTATLFVAGQGARALQRLGWPRLAPGLPGAAAAAAGPLGRGLSIDRHLGEKERAVEKAYFSKQDELALRKLLAKAKAQADDAAPCSKEREALVAALQGHALPDEVLDRLVAWRHSPDY